MYETHHRLISEVAEGNSASFKKLFEEFKDRVYNTALSYLQNAEEAEEITQDVFVEIFHSSKKFKGESSVSTWIYRIAVNKSLDQLRHRKRKKRFAYIASLFSSETGELRFDKPNFEHPGVVLENKENSKTIFKAIQKLPESQQTAFLLSFVEGLPRQEVAEVMNTSLKAVESLLHRAKQNLRNELDSFYNKAKD